MSPAARLSGISRNRRDDCAPAGEAPRDRIEFHHDLAEARETWVELHRRAEASPYQSFAWFSAWFEELGAPRGWTPFIVVARDMAGEPLLLLPLVQRRRFGCTLIEFGGEKHSNLNMPLMAPEAPRRLGDAILRRLSDEIRRSRRGVVVLRFVNMPSRWKDRPNPLAARGAQGSPSGFHAATLDDDLKAWTEMTLSPRRRLKLDYNMRKLAGLGATRWLRAFDQQQADRIVEAFIRQKGQQLKRKGIRDPFQSDGFRRFLRHGAMGRVAERDRAIELYALEMNGEIVATLGAAVGGDMFSVMFLSIRQNSAAAKFSPGEMLLWHTINAIHERGFRRFDLGIGEAPYKTRFCPSVTPLHDAFIGLSVPGRVVAHGMKLFFACKAWIKRHPALLATARRALRPL